MIDITLDFNETIQDKIKEINTSISDLKTLLDDELKSKSDQLQAIEKRRVEIENVKKKINVTLTTDPINLNVGGMKFQTSKETLTKIPGSYFDVLVGGEVDIKPLTLKPKTIFIDRDGTHFRYVLNYLRDDGNIQIPDSIKADLKKEFVFYNMVTFKVQTPSIIIDDDKFKIINSWFEDMKLNTFELLYRGSENAFTTASFHQKCDGKGATITIVQTTDGNVFGGYCSQSWNSAGQYFGDANCFIFTLVNQHNIPPTKYTPKSNLLVNGVYGHSTCGPTFGGGHDFFIANNANANNQSYQKFSSNTFIDTTGRGLVTLTPTTQFTVKEYEVYQVITQ